MARYRVTIDLGARGKSFDVHYVITKVEPKQSPIELASGCTMVRSARKGAELEDSIILAACAAAEGVTS